MRLYDRLLVIIRRLGPEQSGPSTPRHSVMFAVDVPGFGTRTSLRQALIREALYLILRRACTAVDLSWQGSEGHREDRGDGMFMLAPADTKSAAVVRELVGEIVKELRRHNRTAPKETRFQLRMAIHIGWYQRDDNGVVGEDVNHLHRLLDAPVLKQCAKAMPGDLALVISDAVHRYATSYEIIDPREYLDVKVHVKETSAVAWLHHPYHLTTDHSARPDPPFRGSTCAGLSQLLLDATSFLESEEPPGDEPLAG
ncbi:hypothetical protein [Actinocorallia populi]|uniref:hypothetical protein n=1 Tax=Actinocorallia populi TaxID=2079200 RepID=UPI000D08C8D5|nr:hypothetical protein [Actinocorallia populi]